MLNSFQHHLEQGWTLKQVRGDEALLSSAVRALPWD